MSDYGKIIVKAGDSSFVGNTVTFNNGSVQLTGTIGADGFCVKFLPAMFHYTVSLAGSTAEVDLGEGEVKQIDLGYTIGSLSNPDWAAIKRLINAGKAAEYINNGDEFSVTLTDGTSLPFLANVNTYGQGEVDFIARWLWRNNRMNASNTNVGGWNATELRNILNTSFLTLLPQDLQDVISEKELKRSAGNQSASLIVAYDKIWLPTELEVFGNITYAASSEATVQHQYPIFPDTASRIKGVGREGTAAHWWLSSPYVSAATPFCAVYASGAPTNSTASTAYGVLPGFRILPESE